MIWRMTPWGPIALLSLIFALPANHCANAQTFNETVNFIFNVKKEWPEIDFDRGFHTELSQHNQDDCTVRIRSVPFIRDGVINLRNVQDWDWKPWASIGALVLKGQGEIFRGEMWIMNQGGFTVGKVQSCSTRCVFFTPYRATEPEILKLRAAFSLLWKYCPPSRVQF